MVHSQVLWGKCINDSSDTATHIYINNREAFLMSNKEIDAQVNALLEITDGNYAKAVYLVCLDISTKESSNYCG